MCYLGLLTLYSLFAFMWAYPAIVLSSDIAVETQYPHALRIV